MMPTAKEYKMIGELDPIEGNWYHHLDKEQDFMVVDVSVKEGTVDIQHFDGDIGPLDDLESDDMNYE
jgi:hypothetical protein